MTDPNANRPQDPPTPGVEPSGPPESPLEPGARAVVARLHAAGFVAYWAGGCVRDRLMGRIPADYDVATNARPDAVESLFPGCIAVGKSFGVLRVPAGDHFYEVATFRGEGDYRDGRRPGTVVFSDPETDAQRRDFTINAMFYDVDGDRVLDYVGGRADIDARVIRCVGDPLLRFQEDHLRMLRAVRFSFTLGFRLDAPTADAIRQLAPLIARVSAERIEQELTRTLVESIHPGDAVAELDRLGLLSVVLPEVAAMKGQPQPPEFHPEGDVFAHTLLMLNLMRTRSIELAYAALLHDVGKPGTATDAGDRIRFHGHAAEGAAMAAAILKRLRFPHDTVDRVVACVRDHMRTMDVRRMRQSTLRRLVGAPTFETELELHRLDCLASHGGLENYEFLVEFRDRLRAEPVLPAPWVTGRDILEMGVPEGPQVGAWRRTAYDAQLDERFPNREELLAWLREEIRRIPSGRLGQV